MSSQKKIKRSFTLVEVLVVVTIIALIAIMAIPNFLRSKINANEVSAQTTLKAISGACESYASANDGIFPSSFDELLTSNPQFLNENYTDDTRNGYNFSCFDQMDSLGYNCAATPKICGSSGNKTFHIITGGSITSESCT